MAEGMDGLRDSRDIEPEYDDQGRLLGAFVHRAVPANVLLGRIERVGNTGDRFRGQMLVDPAHPFFFEHALDHVPSMMLIEAGRQLGIAVSHLFLGVPLDTAFAPTNIKAEFTEYAELDAPVSIGSSVTDKNIRRGRLVSMVLEGEFQQLGRTIGRMSGCWTMMPHELYARFRRMRRLAADRDPT